MLLFLGGFSPNLLSDLPEVSCAREGGGAQDVFGGRKKEKTLLSVQIASLWFYYFGSAEQII